MVDDERDALDLYGECLRAAGWDVAPCETGDDALVVAPVYVPDIIIMDLAMPGLDGFETMMRLRVHPRTERIPIVVLTGLAGSTRRAKRFGANIVLFKPCAADALASTLEAVVTDPGSRRLRTRLTDGHLVL